MARLWARTVTFESVNVGDQLPVLVKWETSETFAGSRSLGSPETKDVEETSQGPSLDPAVLRSYVTELLEKAFPISSITATGSQIMLETLAPVRPEDTISLTGGVTAKRQDGDQNLVECEIIIENQEGTKVGRAVARVSL